jgi:hypothetical protein
MLVIDRNTLPIQLERFSPAHGSISIGFVLMGFAFVESAWIRPCARRCGQRRRCSRSPGADRRAAQILCRSRVVERQAGPPSYALVPSKLATRQEEHMNTAVTRRMEVAPVRWFWTWPWSCRTRSESGVGRKRAQEGDGEHVNLHDRLFQAIFAEMHQ